MASASIAAEPPGTGSLRYSTSDAPSGPDHAARGVPGTIQVDGGTGRHDGGGCRPRPIARRLRRPASREARTALTRALDNSASFDRRAPRDGTPKREDSVAGKRFREGEPPGEPLSRRAQAGASPSRRSLIPNQAVGAVVGGETKTVDPAGLAVGERPVATGRRGRAQRDRPSKAEPEAGPDRPGAGPRLDRAACRDPR